MAWRTVWSREAQADVRRHRDFVAAHNPAAARGMAQALTNAPKALNPFPRVGQQLMEYRPREVRYLIVEGYEFRYELEGSLIRILRIYHGREDR